MRVGYVWDGVMWMGALTCTSILPVNGISIVCVLTVLTLVT